MQRTNKHIKRCIISLITRKMKTKASMRYTMSQRLEWLVLEKPVTANAGKFPLFFLEFEPPCPAQGQNRQNRHALLLGI